MGIQIGRRGAQQQPVWRQPACHAAAVGQFADAQHCVGPLPEHIDIAIGERNF
jgi:hypothetical protein